MNEKRGPRPRLCITLDLENDYGRLDRYRSFSGLGEVEALIERYGIRLTTFVTGRVLEDRGDVVDRLRRSGSEFGLHSYSHTIHRPLSPSERMDEIRRGVSAFRAYFQRMPISYRAPQGVISGEELALLSELGFEVDASVFPSYRAGLFDNRKAPTDPFQYDNGMWEIPFSVVPGIRLPIALSYMQFFGWNPYRMFFRLFGMPGLVVFDFHMHNIMPTPEVRGLPLPLRLFYSRNHHRGVPILEAFLRYMIDRGYDFIYLREAVNGSAVRATFPGRGRYRNQTRGEIA